MTSAFRLYWPNRRNGTTGILEVDNRLLVNRQSHLRLTKFAVGPLESWTGIFEFDGFANSLKRDHWNSEVNKSLIELEQAGPLEFWIDRMKKMKIERRFKTGPLEILKFTKRKSLHKSTWPNLKRDLWNLENNWQSWNFWIRQTEENWNGTTGVLNLTINTVLKVSRGWQNWSRTTENFKAWNWNFWNSRGGNFKAGPLEFWNSKVDTHTEFQEIHQIWSGTAGILKFTKQNFSGNLKRDHWNSELDKTELWTETSRTSENLKLTKRKIKREVWNRTTGILKLLFLSNKNFHRKFQLKPAGPLELSPSDKLLQSLFFKNFTSF